MDTPAQIQHAPDAFSVTTAIAYANGSPHLGHAYEYVAADALARFKRLDGFTVQFITGTDEYGAKIARTAAAEGVRPTELVDRNAAVFRDLHRTLGSTYDRFIRTTDAEHHTAVSALWERLVARGDIYLGHYSGWYSVRDERFFTEDETRIDAAGVRVAVETGTPVEWTEEPSYRFRLSAYAEPLLEHYREHPEFIAPEERRNEVLSLVSGGLEDISVSRTTFDWGISVPGDPDHLVYVWLDALTNYLTATGFPDTESDLYRRHWPVDLHIIGKDILKFHAIFWPAFLLSAGLPLPRRVFAHGFLTSAGQKLSKSAGNGISADELVDRFGVDSVRYYLLREIPFGQDGDVSDDALIARTNADLSNDLGNLAQRALTLVHTDIGTVPEPGPFSDADTALLELADQVYPQVRAAFDAQAIHRGIESIWSLFREVNRYFTAQAPWKLRKSEDAADVLRCRTVLHVTLECLRIGTILAQPVIPESAARILDQIGVPERLRDFTAIPTRLIPGSELPPPSPVFPRFEDSVAAVGAAS